MAKIQTITENFLFSKVYSKGKSCAKKSIVVYCLNNYRSDKTRIGITASKKLGGAVERNRARRLIREAFRILSKENPAFSRPYLIVIVARSRLFERDVGMQEVYGDMKESFLKLGIIKPVGGIRD